MTQEQDKNENTVGAAAQTSQKNAKAWGGVFTEATDDRMEKFSESISFDKRMYAQDIAGSIAHARMLCDVNLLSAEEFRAIEAELNAIKERIEQGVFQYSTALEDIHMHIEKALIDKLGDVGRKLHTARSRNDQVSTDFRLWIRDAIDSLDRLLAQLQRAFVARCDDDFDVVVPAYTHTQRAQPVLAPHIWLAYVEKFQRDRERLQDCRKRVNTLSLGAAACAGTSLPIDRAKTAQYLGFEAIAANSVDVSSDRDFALEFAFDAAQIALHLSGWAEDWIWQSTVEFSFLKLPQSFCTGSSIMPQKINPDTLELIRGKSARVIGNLTALMTLVKGLPLAYNRDLQEDKERVFDSYDSVADSLAIAAPLVAATKLDRDSIAKRINQGYLDATSLMEYLIRCGVPQRAAHGIVGELVRVAVDSHRALAELPLATFQDACDLIEQNVYDYLGADNAVKAMQSYGSTAPSQVRAQIERWKEKLEL
ncbi:MAG: argininosuccinate lyase [Planctomycetia bacterium]|nr:argininosuccinate lyase [Planctomycetia bacterium]